MARSERELAEIWRYLGHAGQELEPELVARVEELAERCDEVARPGMVRRTLAPDALALPGNDIARHLEGAIEVVFFAATLGHDVDRELRRLGATDPLDQLIFDAVATAAVERLANEAEAQVRAEAAERGLFCSWRFSPGYGDLPLHVQPQFLQVLDATRRLGITLTPSNLMVPTKSVTALVGIHPTAQPGLATSCAVCQLADYCELRKRGATCRLPETGE